jgi:hypothetical protein
MQQLQRSYIFEFAGMPRSGKTLAKEILAHYLKRMDYPLVEYNGGSRYSRLQIYRMSIGELNERLAQDIESFVRSIVEKQDSDHNIYLLDRGLIDRCIFTDALVQDKKVSPEQAERLYKSLTMPELLEKLDGVFIFVTSPETALYREYADKLVERENVRSQGDVMNELFLHEMRLAAQEWNKRVNRRRDGSYVRYTKFIDTTPKVTDFQKVAKDVFDGIKDQYPELEFQLTSANKIFPQE